MNNKKIFILLIALVSNVIISMEPAANDLMRTLASARKTTLAVPKPVVPDPWGMAVIDRIPPQTPGMPATNGLALLPREMRILLSHYLMSTPEAMALNLRPLLILPQFEKLIPEVIDTMSNKFTIKPAVAVALLDIPKAREVLMKKLVESQYTKPRTVRPSFYQMSTLTWAASMAQKIVTDGLESLAPGEKNLLMPLLFGTTIGKEFIRHPIHIDDIIIANTHGQIPAFYMGLSHGSVELTGLFLTADYPITSRYDGMKPLNFSLINLNPHSAEITRLLLEAGDEVDKPMLTHVVLSREPVSYEVLEVLLKKMKPDLRASLASYLNFLANPKAVSKIPIGLREAKITLLNEYK